jgi:hypothetical protein
MGMVLSSWSTTSIEDVAQAAVGNMPLSVGKKDVKLM